MQNHDHLLTIIVAAFLGLFVVVNSYRLADDQFAAAAVAAAAPTGSALYSSLSWQPLLFNAPWQRRDSHFAYVFDDNLFVGGGLDATDTFEGGKPREIGETAISRGKPVYEKATYFNDIWQTSDGVNWQKVVEHSDLPLIRSMSVFELGGKLYGIGGWGPDIGYNVAVFESGDGINWRQTAESVSFGPREGMRALTHSGKAYLFGGVNYEKRETHNDVWESADGVTWKPVVKNAPWAPRWDHDIAFFKNKFWLVGGMNLNLDGFADVWYSDDATNWTLATNSAPFGSRQGLALVSYRGALFIVGGLDAKTNEGKNEVWFSKNGFDWEKTSQDTLWISREDHEALVFNGKILMFGGMSTNWRWKNDVWVVVLP